MSDIIFSLKSKKANLAMKLESCVKQDHTGVYFYSQAKFALDMMELDKEETMTIEQRKSDMTAHLKSVNIPVKCPCAQD